MFADLSHFHHLTQLHIDFGATQVLLAIETSFYFICFTLSRFVQIGISNGSVVGTDHAGQTSTSAVGTKGESGVSGGGELVNGLHNGGTAINGYIHDFGHK